MPDGYPQARFYRSGACDWHVYIVDKPNGIPMAQWSCWTRRGAERTARKRLAHYKQRQQRRPYTVS